MEGPVAALARFVGSSGDLDEAVVGGEALSKRVLPSLVITVVGVLRNEGVDLVECAHALLGILDCHGDE